jgi:hypothetical protein
MAAEGATSATLYAPKRRSFASIRTHFSSNPSECSEEEPRLNDEVGQGKADAASEHWDGALGASINKPFFNLHLFTVKRN